MLTFLHFRILRYWKKECVELDKKAWNNYRGNIFFPFSNLFASLTSRWLGMASLKQSTLDHITKKLLPSLMDRCHWRQNGRRMFPYSRLVRIILIFRELANPWLYQSAVLTRVYGNIAGRNTRFRLSARNVGNLDEYLKGACRPVGPRTRTIPLRDEIKNMLDHKCSDQRWMQLHKNKSLIMKLFPRDSQVWNSLNVCCVFIRRSFSGWVIVRLAEQICADIGCPDSKIGSSPSKFYCLIFL